MTFLPRFTVEEALADGRLVQLPVDMAAPTLSPVCAHHKGSGSVPCSNAFGPGHPDSAAVEDHPPGHSSRGMVFSWGISFELHSGAVGDDLCRPLHDGGRGVADVYHPVGPQSFGLAHHAFGGQGPASFIMSV